MRSALSIAMILLAACAHAANDPFTGPDQFPQFRHLSGLSGAGYGVDAQGFPSIDGPIAFSTPIAHVLGRGSWRLGGGRTSFGRRPRLSSGLSNGTFQVAYGHTFGSVNVIASDLVLSSTGDNVFNLQAQWMRPNETGWTAAVGVQDLLGDGGSAGEGLAGDERSSTSVFGVVTTSIAGLPRPLYVSAGVGGRRFADGFASASYQLARPWRAYAEYDGFGVNAGIVYSLRTGEERRPIDIDILAGMVDTRYFTLGLGIGF